MGKEFEDKVAMGTGGSRGTGRAAAVRLAEGGARIAIASAGNDGAAAAAKAECGKAGAPAVPLLKFDDASPEACGRAVDEAVTALGGVHVLVNSAGMSVEGFILRYKAEDLRRTL